MRKIELNSKPMVLQHLERTKKVKCFRSQEVKRVLGKEWPTRLNAGKRSS